MNFLEWFSKYIPNKFYNTHSVAEKLFQADTQKNGRTDKHKIANSPFSQVFVGL